MPLLGLFLAGVYTFSGFAVLATERSVPVRLDIQQIATLAREVGWVCLLGALAPLGLWSSPPRPRAPRPELPQRTPVVLVPGLGANRSAMWVLSTFLTWRGWRWAWPVNLGSRNAPLPEHAAVLGERVEQLCRAAGCEQVDLVCHSFGGVVAAWYLRHQQGSRRVRRLVTLGTPWRGTRMAVFGQRREARDILPGAPALDDLTPPGVPTVAIWSPDDEMIIPSQSALPDGAEGICIESAGHNELICSARALRAVQESLAAVAEVAQ